MARMKMRGPSAFTVIAVDVPKGRDIECGNFETLEEARGCVEFDRLRSWEIWQGDHIVERSGNTVEW
jgi:hypothetical protein